MLEAYYRVETGDLNTGAHAGRMLQIATFDRELQIEKGIACTMAAYKGTGTEYCVAVSPCAPALVHVPSLWTLVSSAKISLTSRSYSS